MSDDAELVVETLSTAQVAELVRVTYRQLDYWVRAGLLPIADVAPGSGGHRRWSPGEVELARVFAVLVHHGIAPALVSGAMPTALIGPRTFAITLGTLTVTGALS